MIDQFWDFILVLDYGVFLKGRVHQIFVWYVVSPNVQIRDLNLSFEGGGEVKNYFHIQN